MARRWWVKLLLLFAIFTIVGLFFGTQLYLLSRQFFERPLSMLVAMEGMLWEWYVWAVFSLPILWLAARFPFDQRRWGRTLATHLPLAVFFALAHVICMGTLSYAMGWPLQRGAQTWTAKVVFYFTVSFHGNVLVYAAIVAISQAAAYYRKYQDRDALLAQAQLRALKMQLQPHFLFNALHATLALIRKDPRTAERMVVRLGELLRATLDHEGEHEAPLRQELHLLELYLEIERIRFQERLSVSMDIDPAALDATVPNMILQPLVENAIRHGIEPRSNPGRITIRANRHNGRLRLAVEDNGPGLPGAPWKEGIGLKNTRARLQRMYGESQKFELSNAPAGGVVAMLEIPATAGATP